MRFDPKTPWAVPVLLAAALATLAFAPGATSVAPTPPPICVPTTTTTASTDTPVTIGSATPVVVSSTISVAGAGPWIADVDVFTDIKHTFSGDLDITVTSPAGTIVTLTTDNGGGSDNVFAGTTWDDQANPGGQVPYTSNSGLASDHTYTNLVTASPLAPEESLAAFVGEDPNGPWLLTISDDASADGGTLDTWSVTITTYDDPPFLGTDGGASAPGLVIPTGPGVVTDTITLSGVVGTVLDLDLATAITHTSSADLDMTLMSPAGTVVTLSTDNGGSNDNVFAGTTWDDDANPGSPVPYTSNVGLATDRLYANLVTATPLVPEETFGAFIGEDPNGVWTLTISDDLSSNGGTLASWSIDLVDAIACPDTVPPTVSITQPVEGYLYAQGNVVPTGTDNAIVIAGPLGFEIQATASDNDVVSEVRFYVDSTLLCTDTAAPYACSWTPGLPGNYVLTAEAEDPSGNIGVSAAVDVFGV